MFSLHFGEFYIGLYFLSKFWRSLGGGGEEEWGKQALTFPKTDNFLLFTGLKGSLSSPLPSSTTSKI